MKLETRLQRRMAEKNLNQRDVAKICGVSSAAVSHFARCASKTKRKTKVFLKIIELMDLGSVKPGRNGSSATSDHREAEQPHLFPAEPPDEYFVKGTRLSDCKMERPSDPLKRFCIVSFDETGMRVIRWLS